jgi:hypothetical protein
LVGISVTEQAQAQNGRDFGTFTPGGIGGDAYLQRQIRSLDADQRAGSLSTGRIGQTQRDLITQSKGVNLTPAQSRIQGDLDRIRQEQSWQATTPNRAQPPPRPRGERLPGTIDDESGLPSFDGAQTVNRLLGRAQDAITAGRTVQARSDLAAARSLADGLSPGNDSERATVADLQARMDNLTRRLGDR